MKLYKNTVLFALASTILFSSTAHAMPLVMPLWAYLTGCVEDVDQILMHGLVTYSDQVTPKDGFPIQSIDLTMIFSDGYSLTAKVQDTSPIMTDDNGEFEIITADLGMGHYEDTVNCTEECGYYDDYGYCEYYYEDCWEGSTWVNLDADDITSLFASINYAYGSSTISTLGQGLGSGITYDTADEHHHNPIREQTELFVTPFTAPEASSAMVAPSSETLPSLHPVARTIRLTPEIAATLNSDVRARLKKARVKAAQVLGAANYEVNL